MNNTMVLDLLFPRWYNEKKKLRKEIARLNKHLNTMKKNSIHKPQNTLQPTDILCEITHSNSINDQNTSFMHSDNYKIQTKQEEDLKKCKTEISEHTSIEKETNNPKNKKESIKERIIKEISQKRLSTYQVKEIIVNEQQLCSKATFYRYVKELKKEKNVDVLGVNNKEFLYARIE